MNFSLLNLIPSFYHYKKLLALLLLIVLVFALKVGNEARRRGMNGWFWGLACLFLPFIFFPIYYFKNKPNIIEEPKVLPVYSHNVYLNVQIAQDVLRENDIACEIINKKDTNYHFGEILLYVNENDFDKAKEIIEANKL